MRTIRKAVILWILLIGMIGVAPQEATAQASVNFQLFYDNLSPHGYWIDNPNYGYVWVPNVSRGFTPYRTNGYWVYTEAGWTWVSNYSWGWAPFHYGRWFYDSYYGWVWVPDNYWGPAWVSWRYYDGYYGWAPIGPSVSASMAFSNGYNIPHSHWVFVKESNFGRRNISNYYISSANNTTFVNKSKVINNIHVDKTTKVRYNAGPNRAEVQKRSKLALAPVNLRERSRPGQSLSGTELQLYKPRVEKEVSKGRKPAPAIVTRQSEVKSITERRNEAIAKRKTVQKEKGTQQMNATRPAANRSRETQYQRELQQEQRRQEVQMQRGEQRVREQEMERRMKEPVQPQRDMQVLPKDPVLQQNPVPQMRRQEMSQQRGNNATQHLGGKNQNRVIRRDK